jgi:hypothetical protein
MNLVFLVLTALLFCGVLAAAQDLLFFKSPVALKFSARSRINPSIAYHGHIAIEKTPNAWKINAVGGDTSMTQIYTRGLSYIVFNETGTCSLLPASILPFEQDLSYILTNAKLIKNNEEDHILDNEVATCEGAFWFVPIKNKQYVLCRTRGSGELKVISPDFVATLQLEDFAEASGVLGDTIASIKGRCRTVDAPGKLAQEAKTGDIKIDGTNTTNYTTWKTKRQWYVDYKHSCYGARRHRNCEIVAKRDNIQASNRTCIFIGGVGTTPPPSGSGLYRNFTYWGGTGSTMIEYTPECTERIFMVADTVRGDYMSPPVIALACRAILYGQGEDEFYARNKIIFTHS